MRLQQWQSGFDPYKQKFTTTQLWVKFYRLPWEFWDLQILVDIAHNIGTPIHIDKATLDGKLGHFACILVNVDLAQTL